MPRRYWDLYDRETISLPQNDLHPLHGEPSETDARISNHGYLVTVSYVGVQVCRLLGKLDELGIADETIIALWGDNDYKLGDNGNWCKMANFETDTCVP